MVCLLIYPSSYHHWYWVLCSRCAESISPRVKLEWALVLRLNVKLSYQQRTREEHDVLSQEATRTNRCAASIRYPDTVQALA